MCILLRAVIYVSQHDTRKTLVNRIIYYYNNSGAFASAIFKTLNKNVRAISPRYCRRFVLLLFLLLLLTRLNDSVIAFFTRMHFILYTCVYVYILCSIHAVWQQQQQKPVYRYLFKYHRVSHAVYYIKVHIICWCVCVCWYIRVRLRYSDVGQKGT